MGMIPVECECGESYELKDAVAGRRVRCFTCDRLIDVPAPRKPARSRPAALRSGALRAAAAVAGVAALGSAGLFGLVLAIASIVHGPAGALPSLSLGGERLAAFAKGLLALAMGKGLA